MTDTAGTVGELALKKDLSLREIEELRSAVRRSVPEKAALKAFHDDFDGKVASRLPQAEHSLRKALFTWMLGDAESATAALKRLSSHAASFAIGLIAEEAGRLEDAREAFAKAAQSNDQAAAFALAGTLLRLGRIDEARVEIDKLEKNQGDRSEILLLRGRLAEVEGEQERALDLFRQALDANDRNLEAAFRIGYILDLRGDEERALEYYERCAVGTSIHIGAMLNMALLFEDRGEYEHAIACYRDVLRAEPANARARILLEGAVESTDEVYDEMERKEKEKLDQVLRQPVTDFELSVRSRNVLQQMNIHTLGDLVQKSEQEMLAYKNFGETSLIEIKHLLGSKNLKLGMGREEVERKHQRERLAMVMSESDAKTLSMSISQLDLSVRSRRCMARLNIHTVGDLITHSEEDLMTTKNFGQTSLQEVRARLSQMGLHLRAGGEVVEQEA